MKIALLGYGKMGKLVEAEALKMGHTIVAKISRGQMPARDLEEADICIDFSHASCIRDNVTLACKANKNIVIGTTGWEEERELVKGLVEKFDIAALAAPNFSIGVHLFKLILERAAELIKGFKAYDVSGLELHHKQKVDAPSGTALMLGDMLANKMGLSSAPSFSSVRCGEIPGIHSIIFDSPVDTITITHEARNRSGFAKGAIDAACWLYGKRGFYTIEDMIGG